jgi:hypothetical protein
MSVRRAQCACSQLSANRSEEPVRISVCLLDCKGEQGSAFSYNARFSDNDVSIRGISTEFTRIRRGYRYTYSFCPHCGTTFYYRNDTQPRSVAIPAGAFADDAFPPPYHGSRRCEWAEIRADSLETFD